MTASKPIVALLTDFGPDSHYVAQMKGVLLGCQSSVSIVDITHSIVPQDIQQAGRVLLDCIRSFPAGTVFVVVVDPGVGTERSIVVVEINGQIFVCPDNGVLSLVLDSYPISQVIEADHQVVPGRDSATFHGRDRMAPLVGKILNGHSLASLGQPLDAAHQIEIISPDQTGDLIAGEVVDVDYFGNLITNLREDILSKEKWANARLEVSTVRLSGVKRTYADVTVGDPLALFGSNGCLELAVNCGNASAEWSVGAGTAVRIVVSD